MTPSNKSTLTKLLPDQAEQWLGRKTLVIDLDETLVHSSFKYMKSHNFSVNVYIAGSFQGIYVNVRPYANEFLKQLSEIYEIVVWTASISEYASAVMDKLDNSNGYIHHRLYREHCELR